LASEYPKQSLSTFSFIKDKLPETICRNRLYIKLLKQNMKANTVILLALKNEFEAFRLGQKLIFDTNEIICVKTKTEITKVLTERTIGLLIIDMEIEDADVVEICKEVRQIKNIQQPYIIVLSQRPEDYVQSLVLDSGADDYMLKPLKTPVVIARIKALLSRKIKLQAKEAEPDTEPKNFFIDKERYVVRINRKEVELPRKEFNILSLLHAQPERVFTRAEITNVVSRKDWLYKDHTIDVYIYNLRKELGGNFIQTIKGEGYKFSFL
jgi:two-component system, OmpR family, alkaline phosphatase synthesis response regulator PhoP